MGESISKGIMLRLQSKSDGGQGGGEKQAAVAGLRFEVVSFPAHHERTSCTCRTSMKEGGNPSTWTNCTSGLLPRLKIMHLSLC